MPCLARDSVAPIPLKARLTLIRNPPDIDWMAGIALGVTAAQAGPEATAPGGRLQDEGVYSVRERTLGFELRVLGETRFSMTEKSSSNLMGFDT